MRYCLLASLFRLHSGKAEQEEVVSLGVAPLHNQHNFYAFLSPHTKKKTEFGHPIQNLFDHMIFIQLATNFPAFL
jgi:hypothetical protein